MWPFLEDVPRLFTIFQDLDKPVWAWEREARLYEDTSSSPEYEVPLSIYMEMRPAFRSKSKHD